VILGAALLILGALLGLVPGALLLNDALAIVLGRGGPAPGDLWETLLLLAWLSVGCATMVAGTRAIWAAWRQQGQAAAISAAERWGAYGGSVGGLVGLALVVVVGDAAFLLLVLVPPLMLAGVVLGACLGKYQAEAPPGSPFPPSVEAAARERFNVPGEPGAPGKTHDPRVQRRDEVCE
jgi:hypothetical protein